MITTKIYFLDGSAVAFQRALNDERDPCATSRNIAWMYSAGSYRERECSIAAQFQRKIKERQDSIWQSVTLPKDQGGSTMTSAVLSTSRNPSMDILFKWLRIGIKNFRKNLPFRGKRRIPRHGFRRHVCFRFSVQKGFPALRHVLQDEGCSGRRHGTAVIGQRTATPTASGTTRRTSSGLTSILHIETIQMRKEEIERKIGKLNYKWWKYKFRNLKL